MGKILGAALALLLSVASAEASNCYIKEFQTIATVQSKVAQIAVDTGNTTDQTPVAIGGSSASSAAFKSGTVLIRVICGANASYSIGASPTATTSNSYLATGIPEYFGVAAGQSIAFISNSSP